MKTIIFSVAVFAFLLFNAAAQQSDYSQLRTAAETEYAQRSYARAHEIYSRVDKSKLTAVELRWVEFRLADTSWRAGGDAKFRHDEVRSSAETTRRTDPCRRQRRRSRSGLGGSARIAGRFFLDPSQSDELGRCVAPLPAGT